MKKSYLLLVLIALGVFGMAQEGFNYQAALRNASGAIMENQNVTVQFTILSGTATGTEVYQETHSATTNDLGLVNLVIGKGTVVSGTFSSIQWGDDTYFINVEVDGTDMGTTQFWAVPYALHALSVENTIWEENNSGAYVSDKHVGIGSPATNDHFYVYSGYAPGELVDFTVDSLLNGSDVLNLAVGNHTDGYGQFIEANLEGDLKFKVDVTGDVFMDGELKVDSVTEDPSPKSIYGNSTPLAYGYSSGSFLYEDYGISSVTFVSTGIYEVVLDNGWIGNPVVQLTAYGGTVTPEICGYSYNTGTKTITVVIWDHNANYRSSDFSIVVYGTPQ